MRKLRIGNKVLTKIDYEKLEREEKERARKKQEENAIIDTYLKEMSRYVDNGRYEFIRYDDPRLNHTPDNVPPVTNSSIISTDSTDIYAVGTTNTYYSPRRHVDIDED